MKSLSNDDVLLFGHLYRRVTSALSTARSQDINDSHIEYLNQLAARSYGYIYVAESKGWPSIPNFFKNEFPQSFRRNLLFIMIAFFITIAGGLFAFGVVRHDLGKADVVLGPEQASIWAASLTGIPVTRTGCRRRAADNVVYDHAE